MVKKLQLAVLLALLAISAFSLKSAQAKSSIYQTFSSAKEGDVDKCKHVRRLFGSCLGIKTDNSRIDIVTHPTNGKVLRFRYPQGQISPDHSGGSFSLSLEPSLTYNFEYTVRFGSDFDYSRGGKLPGLAGGRVYNGGRPATNGDGFNARLHWNTNGVPTLYLYYQDQPGIYGQHIPMDVSFNFVPNGQYRITQYLQMNTSGQANGIFRLWIDGQQVLNRSDIRFMSYPSPVIDRVSFDSFFGGGDSSFAPSRNTHADFDNIRIW
jgi:hypothetical protein